jgi:hypothetical protein
LKERSILLYKKKKHLKHAAIEREISALEAEYKQKKTKKTPQAHCH